MKQLTFTLATLGIIATANSQAFAGNLVSDGLDDPHVVPAYEEALPEWDCYPWMPEDFSSYRHYRNHRMSGWCDTTSRADTDIERPRCQGDCGPQKEFETKAESILRVHGVYNTNDLSEGDWAAVGAFWDANGGPNGGSQADWSGYNGWGG